MQPWLAPPREDFTEAQVQAALAFDRAPLIRHGVTVLDSSDIATGETIDVLDGSVKWTYRPPDRATGQSTEEAEVRRTASLTVSATGVSLGLRRYLIWTEWLGPDGVWVRFHLGVFIPTLPPTTDDGVTITHALELADKTYRYATTLLPEPITIAAAANPVFEVVDSLRTVFGESSFAIPATDVVLTDPMVFDAGISYLSFYSRLLGVAAMDGLSADANGRPASVTLADLAGKGPEITYGPAAGKILTAGEVAPLLPTLPNVLVFVAREGPSLPEEGNGMRTVLNQSSGPASIDSRGERVVLRIDLDVENQAELDAIASADAQRYFAGGGLRFQGQVALNPRHDNRDVVSLDKPRLGLSGAWLVTEWSYPLQPLTGESAVLMPIVCEARVAVTEEA